MAWRFSEDIDKTKTFEDATLEILMSSLYEMVEKEQWVDIDGVFQNLINLAINLKVVMGALTFCFTSRSKLHNWHILISYAKRSFKKEGHSEKQIASLFRGLE